MSALLIPAITQQWTDRQKDVEIKSALIKQMAESAAVAVNNVRFLGSGGNPEAHVSNTLCRTTDPTAPGPKSQECKKARRDATFATAKITTETRVDWRRASASARGQLIAYFSGISARWAQYSDNLERFLEIFNELLQCLRRARQRPHHLPPEGHEAQGGRHLLDGAAIPSE